MHHLHLKIGDSYSIKIRIGCPLSGHMRRLADQSCIMFIIATQNLGSLSGYGFASYSRTCPICLANTLAISKNYSGNLARVI
jgi:hypothetical protein